MTSDSSGQLYLEMTVNDNAKNLVTATVIGVIHISQVWDRYEWTRRVTSFGRDKNEKIKK